MTQRHKKKCTTFENKTHDDGNSRRNKIKQNRKSKVNELESIRTRTTPTALFSAMGILNADRKKCLQEMGFGSMIGMPLHEIPGMLGLYVIQNLDIEKNELALADGSIQVTPLSVHDILGVPIGGTSIESLTPRKPDDPFIKEWKSQFGEKSEVRPNDITDVIVSSNDAGSLFKMNFLMLFANTMGMCESSGACSMFILKQISNDVRVENLDWCSYIINCLKPSKNKWVNQASNYYIGPLTFMTLLYLDSTRCDSFNVVRERPAIRAWKSIQMKYREKLEIEKYGGFGMLPKHDLQSEDFVEMIQQNCNNIHQELATISSKLNEGLSRFPDCQKLNQFVIKFEEGFSKKDLADKEDVGKEVCSMRENENVEAVETSLCIKRRGHPMKRGRDDENIECVEIPSPIKRRSRPKKSGRDNENQDAEAVELLLSIKGCERPTKHSYHWNVEVGQLAEMKSFKQGFRGAWFRCKINDIDLKKNKIKLEYCNFEEEISWTKIYALPPRVKKSSGKKKQLMLRPQYPLLHDRYYKNEQPPVNSVSEICVVIDDAWKVGDMVDWYKDDCYWSARVIKVLSNDKVQIELPMPPAGEGRDGDILIAFCKDLRPSLDWSQRKGWTLPNVDGQASCGAQLIFPSKQGMTSHREEVEHAAAPGGDSPLNASSTTGTGNGISVNSSAERQISEPRELFLKM